MAATSRTLALAGATLWLLVAGSRAAQADERAQSTVTWFQERRAGNEQLTVLHPQIDLGFDLGETTEVGLGYTADLVSGATPSVYAAPRPGQSVDAVSAATRFTDTRHVGRASLGFRGRRSSLFLGYAYGAERDYRSHTVTGGAQVDLPGKNTTFGVSYSHDFDQACDYRNGDASPLERRALTGENPCFTDDAAAMTVAREVDIDTMEAVVTQNLSPIAVVQLGIYGQLVKGFQSNPYRRVRVAGVDAQENLPLRRGRAAVFGRLNLAIPPLRAFVGFDLRGYSDTWGIGSGTAEVTYKQYMGSALLFRFRARGYQQSGAVFWLDALDLETGGTAGNGEFFTGDRELAPLRSLLFGAKMSYITAGQEGRDVWGLFDEVELHIKADGLYTTPLTETAPGGDVSGPLPDAIIAQLGLRFLW